MRFVMCGAGAIGGVIGGQLAKAGQDVIFVDPWAAHIEAIQRDGLRLKGVHGTHVLRVPVVPAAAMVDFRPDDAIILSVKSFRTEEACTALRRATALDLPVFCAQNGVRNEGVAARHFRQTNGVMVLIGAKCMVPGEVVHTGAGPLGVGTYPKGLSPAARDVAAALGKTDIPVYTTDDVVAHKWNKMLRNLNNATMGLTGLCGQEAWADRAVREWMADVQEEGLRVLQAAKISFTGPPGVGSIETHIADLRGDKPGPPVPTESEPKHYASLWQDLYHQRGEVEADYFNGEIVRLGAQHGVPTPYSGLLLELIGGMADAREKPGKYTIQELRARLAARR